MSNQFIGVYEDNREETIIIEISAQDVQTIAQALHLAMADNPNSKTFSHALNSLRDQTEHVFSNGVYHKVYADPLTTPKDTKQISGIYYRPVDFYD